MPFADVKSADPKIDHLPDQFIRGKQTAGETFASKMMPRHGFRDVNDGTGFAGDARVETPLVPRKRQCKVHCVQEVEELQQMPLRRVIRFDRHRDRKELGRAGFQRLDQVAHPIRYERN